ncbi:hypothetical protein L2E82_42776 [Cichorium intybus]|uniref:Uncharacterized protein n=1 Tax=Cichorium intybus TaxID=13427 RepID=A0ACB8ZM47_CICIN|nr:hypothetical protein L2E82_42776 [Cichorium intybus]
MSDYHLCEELIIEILTRLPPKSLLRFRSVSKSLRSCIDSPEFMRMHTCRSPQSVVMRHLVRKGSRDEYGCIAFCTLHTEDQLPLRGGYIGITAVNFPCRSVSITGSCNGIMSLFEYQKGIIYLWNPSVMRQLTLPDCPRRCTQGICIGIGFDPITDDNKIVSIPLLGGTAESAFVYAMKTRAWCPIASPVPLYTAVFSTSYYLNGVLHWVVGTFEDGEYLRYIMTLDLSTHVFGMIDLPKPTWETLNLSTIQGSLAVSSTLIVDTWIWVRRDASWSLVFRSKTNQVRGVNKALQLTNNGDLLLDTFDDEFQVYNPKTGARSTLVNFSDGSLLFEMNPHVETLQLLQIGTACEANHFFSQERKKRKRF